MNRPGTTHDVTTPTELDELPEGTVIRTANGDLVEKTGCPGTGWERLYVDAHMPHTELVDGMPLQILYLPSPPPPVVGSYLADHELARVPVGSVVLVEDTVLKKVGDDQFEGLGVTEDNRPIDAPAVRALGPVKLIHDGT
jgi:hypothetical protein